MHTYAHMHTHSRDLPVHYLSIWNNAEQAHFYGFFRGKYFCPNECDSWNITEPTIQLWFGCSHGRLIANYFIIDKTVSGIFGKCYLEHILVRVRFHSCASSISTPHGEVQMLSHCDCVVVTKKTCYTKFFQNVRHFRG